MYLVAGREVRYEKNVVLAAALDEIAAVSREHTANMNVEITLTERSLPYLGTYLYLYLPTYLTYLRSEIPMRRPASKKCTLQPTFHCNRRTPHHSTSPSDPYEVLQNRLRT